MERPIVSPKTATRNARRIDWLDSPRRSPLTSVVWKQFRESVPIALAGFAGIVGTAVFIYMAEGGMKRFAHVFSEVSITLGLCIALVAGIGVALQDMGPRLNTFWRSRPIDGSLWFWTKFATGLLIVIAVIYLPQLLFAGFGGYAELNDAEAIPVAALLHIASYATAVAMTCLVRHAVYSAILSIGALAASLSLLLVAWMTPTWLGWMDSAMYEQSGYVGDRLHAPMIATALLICFAVWTLIGWLATRNDWGWKSRY
jgi:hypothetical protein